MLPGWAKIAAPLVVAGSGLTAGGIALLSDDSVPTANAAPAAWIDFPLDQATLIEGLVVVQGHASVSSGLTALTLSVDGVVVATDDTLEFNEGLAYGTFEWNAVIGVHDLVVAGADTTSMTHQVTVVGRAAPTTIPATTSTTTTTTTTTPPTTTTPATIATVPQPADVSDVAASPSNVFVCSDNSRQVTITATVRRASSAQVQLTGSGASTIVAPMTIAGSTASATVTLQLNLEATYTATVEVSGPGGSDSASTTFTTECKP